MAYETHMPFDCRYQIGKPAEPISAKEIFVDNIADRKFDLLSLMNTGAISGDAYFDSMHGIVEAQRLAIQTIAFDCLPRKMAVDEGNILLNNATRPAIDEMARLTQRVWSDVSPSIQEILKDISNA
jgi:hypothetical protein